MNKSEDYINNNYMSLAIELALKGQGTVSPNPMVGCVIVKNNKILSTGYHKEYGAKHAEIDAIENCLDKSELAGSVVYINLEPCCHYGKTPPCVSALIKYRVGTVVVAMVDPNPLVAGKSIKLLEDNNIQVILGTEQKRAEEINKGFISRVTKKRPYVISKIAASLDGKIALRNGESKWITSDKSRKDVMLLRSTVDCIVTTSNTVIQDNPNMTVRGLNKIAKLIRVVLDKKLDTDITYNIYKNQDIAKTILITDIKYYKINNSKIETKINNFLNNNIDIQYFELNLDNKFNILEIWQFLAEYKQGCNKILIEAGGNFNGYLLENNKKLNLNLVDQWVIYNSGLIMGDHAMPMFSIDQQHSMSELFKLKCEQIKQIDDNWRITLCSQE